jgi:hypothetical protein
MLAGIGVTVAMTRDDTRTVTASSTVPGVKATLRVHDDEGTLRISGMPAAPKGRVYQVWLQKGKGRPQPTDALFNTRTDGHASVEVPGGIDGVDAVMVTREPRGGSQVPSEEPSVIARLS